MDVNSTVKAITWVMKDKSLQVTLESVHLVDIDSTNNELTIEILNPQLVSIDKQRISAKIPVNMNRNGSSNKINSNVRSKSQEKNKSNESKIETIKNDYKNNKNECTNKNKTNFHSMKKIFGIGNDTITIHSMQCAQNMSNINSNIDSKEENAGTILVLRMNGGSKHQSVFNPTFMKYFHQALDFCSQLPGTKYALLIIGTAQKYFSLGLDLKYLGSDMKDINEVACEMTSIYKKLLLLNMPTIACLNGHAFGAGIFIGMCCDWRLMKYSNISRLCFPEIRLNINISHGWRELLARKLLPQTYRTAILTGKKWTCDESLKAQIIDHLIYVDEEGDDDVFLKSCMQYVLDRDIISVLRNRRNYQRLKEDLYFDILVGFDRHMNDANKYGLHLQTNSKI